MNRTFCYSSLGENGRLGNQLFQVAATLALAEEHKSQAKFPAWEYAKYFKGHFDETLDKTTITHIYREPHFHYAPFQWINTHALKNYGEIVVNLEGYFQSWKYFEPHKEKILSALEFKPETIEKVSKEFCVGKYSDSNFYGKNVIAVHFRYGDYEENPYYSELKKIDYYEKAIRLLNAHSEKSQVIVFSDDHEKATQEIIRIKEKLGSAMGGWRVSCSYSAAEDLCLMSLCRHFISANSSFSWWGAYLGRAQDKIVIQPIGWFAGDGLRNDTKDIYLENAIVL